MGMTVMEYQTIKSVPTLLGDQRLLKPSSYSREFRQERRDLPACLYAEEKMTKTYFIDGDPVYQMNHLGGLFSAYNADATTARISSARHSMGGKALV